MTLEEGNLSMPYFHRLPYLDLLPTYLHSRSYTERGSARGGTFQVVVMLIVIMMHVTRYSTYHNHLPRLLELARTLLIS